MVDVQYARFERGTSSEAYFMTSTATTGGANAANPSAAKLPAVNLQRGEFVNEAFTDFSKPENKAAMVAALAQVKAMFGREYPLTIGGERVFTVAKTESLHPSQPDQVIGGFKKATGERANT